MGAQGGKAFSSRQPETLSTLVRQLTRFNLVGILNTTVDFSLFFLLDMLGMPYLLAQTCSYSCGIANSYFFNKYWTFGMTGIKSAEMLRFAMVSLTALGISVLLVYLFHSTLNFSLLTSKIAATILTMLFSFFGSRQLVFRPETKPIDP
ncbi:membrane protein, GtrA superfamily [Geotalea daltonii FRC-32]|uniref:Membrane protein, GtrA superfamily n=1 Tax=Geotalea daltonii (strain DSM 22248 / JCM 15807 / FRC-32) TaxID=316067 RepID=B9M9D2_GEODF|nr:membrane protein, GtrA superfamily [Geotalea daltonii FRC-32]